MVTVFKWDDGGEEKLPIHREKNKLIMVRQKADPVMIQWIRLRQFWLQSRMLPGWEENWGPRTSTWHAALKQKFQGRPLYHQGLKLITCIYHVIFWSSVPFHQFLRNLSFCSAPVQSRLSAKSNTSGVTVLWALNLDVFFMSYFVYDAAACIHMKAEVHLLIITWLINWIHHLY